MHSYAIDMINHFKLVAEKNDQPFHRLFTINSVVAMLMQKFDCSEEKAVITASKALAELEQVSNCFIDMNHTTSHGVALNINGYTFVISTRQMLEMLQQKERQQAVMH